MTALHDRHLLAKDALIAAAPHTTLLVSEVFGPTIQGEGPSAGQRAVFLRLGGCNLTCHGCDTPYTWRWSKELPHDKDRVYDPKAELARLPFNELAEKIELLVGTRKGTILVVTGGEPMLQAERLTNFLGFLTTTTGLKKTLGLRIEVETNGTREPTRGLLALVDQWNVSPKLSHWGNPIDKAFKPQILNVFLETGKAIFKFVCNTPADVDEASCMCDEVRIPPEKVWIMPEGLDPLTLLIGGECVRDETLKLGYNFTTRLQILLYGRDMRGV